jgi:hypothetical protein
MRIKILSLMGMFLLCAGTGWAYQGESEDYWLRAVVASAGNTYTATDVELMESVGEPNVGPTYDEEYSIQAGFYCEYYIPPPLPTPAATSVVKDSFELGDNQIKALNNRVRPGYGEFTIIRWQQKDNARVYLKICTINGDLVKILIDGVEYAGKQNHQVTWDARDKRGRVVGSGIYIVYIQGPFKGYTKVAVIK